MESIKRWCDDNNQSVVDVVKLMRRLNQKQQIDKVGSKKITIIKVGSDYLTPKIKDVDSNYKKYISYRVKVHTESVERGKKLSKSKKK